MAKRPTVEEVVTQTQEDLGAPNTWEKVKVYLEVNNRRFFEDRNELGIRHDKEIVEPLFHGSKKTSGQQVLRTIKALVKKVKVKLKGESVWKVEVKKPGRLRALFGAKPKVIVNFSITRPTIHDLSDSDSFHLELIQVKA